MPSSGKPAGASLVPAAVATCAGMLLWRSKQLGVFPDQPSFVQQPMIHRSLQGGGASLRSTAENSDRIGVQREPFASSNSHIMGTALLAIGSVGIAACRRKAPSARTRTCRYGYDKSNPIGPGGFHATPQKVPVVDMSGEQIGEEIMDMQTASPETANYVVHEVNRIWTYQKTSFTRFAPRRGDLKKGPKPWAQKGSGRARHGSRASPLFGKSVTNKGPHGLDSKRKKVIRHHTHNLSISTVLQSKWRCMKIIQGLEDWDEMRQDKLEQCLQTWTGHRCGSKYTLVISRSGYGWRPKGQNREHPNNWDSPIYMSGRYIPRVCFRRPRDIDPEYDGNWQLLKARRVVISREAFFDLKAKYEYRKGWAFMDENAIQLQQFQELAKETPVDREYEMQMGMTLPLLEAEREEWAQEQRKMLALEEAADTE